MPKDGPLLCHDHNWQEPSEGPDPAPSPQDDLSEALIILGQEPTEAELSDMIKEVDTNGETLRLLA